MAESTIEWTDATWNPTTGCDQTSPGCDNCYALTMAARLKAMGQAKYQTDGDPRTSGPGFALSIHPDTLSIPHRWSNPRMIFVNSMSDLFHRDVPVEFMRDVFAVMADTPRHTYQLLTKRSKRLSRLADVLDWPPNLWVGVSVETQQYGFRIDHLREVPAAVRFLSIEPLLGPVSVDLDGIDWVIVGGESGSSCRAVDPESVRGIRDACIDSGTPFFFKQWAGELRSRTGACWMAAPGTSIRRQSKSQRLHDCERCRRQVRRQVRRRSVPRAATADLGDGRRWGIGRDSAVRTPRRSLAGGTCSRAFRVHRVAAGLPGHTGHGTHRL